MDLDPVVNFGKVTLSTGYDSTATAVVLASGDGAILPNPGTDGAFNLVWFNSTDYGDPTDDPNREIVRVTSKTTDTLNISRAQEGTSATNKNLSGKTYQLILTITAKMINDIKDSIPTVPTWIKDSIANGGMTGLINNVNTIYFLSQIPIAFSGTLQSNGQPLTEGVDYTVNTALKKITMSTPLPSAASGLPLEFKYQFES